MILRKEISNKEDLVGLCGADGVAKVVWCFWWDGDLTPNRRVGLELIRKNLNLPVCLVTKNNIAEFVLKDRPLHSAFSLLSDVHKSDYMRAYLLHCYGGCWSDIKPVAVSYAEAMILFSSSDAILMGKPEIEGGAAAVHSVCGKWMPDEWQSLVATNRWIGRADTLFSAELLESMNEFLSRKHMALLRSPAKGPYDCLRPDVNPLAISIPHYPIQWTFIGDFFHPLVYKYRESVLKTLPVDEVENLGLPYR